MKSLNNCPVNCPILTVLFVLFILCAPPVQASNLPGTFSAGIGGGFGDNDMGPFVLSGKFWSSSWEAGAEMFYDGDKNDTIDQIGLAWAMYRFELHDEDRNRPYIGVGAGGVFEENSLQDSFGLMGTVGWDGKDYGMQFKYGYFDPSIYSFVLYWHF